MEESIYLGYVMEQKRKKYIDWGNIIMKYLSVGRVVLDDSLVGF